MGGGGDIVMPAQPNYSEALGESLRAQVDLLRGTGDFDDTGGLRELVREYEAPLRRETAQIDTDVLRQTLLGTERKVVRDPETGKFGIPGAEVVGQQQFRIEESFTEKLNGKGVTQFDLVNPDTGDLISREFISDKTPAEARLELSKNKEFTKGFSEADIERLKNPDTDFASANFGGGEPQTAGGGRYQVLMTDPGQRPGKNYSNGINPTYAIIDTETGGISETFGGEEGVTLYQYRESNKNNLESISTKLVEYNNAIEQAGGDVGAPAREFEFTNPNIPADPSKAGQEGFDSEGRALLQEGQVVREGDGMIDLLGDRRGAIDPVTGLPTERQAGFDEQGNFLGLSALAEDIQRGNLSRQREADLADVERLSDRFQRVMEDYKPETSESLSDARKLIQSAGRRLGVTPEGESADAEGIIDIPKDGTFGGDATGMVMRDVLVDQAPTLDAATTYNQSVDPLRQALLTQAQEGLNEGLTDRERSAIEQASRARQVASGRIFDPTATVQEAQAVIEGDRNRLMQNRAFAQSALGQEAGLQDRVLGRGLQQDQAQAGLDQQRNLAQAQIRQQAAQFGAESGLRAALANQAQRQQAAQFDVGAKLDAQTREEELRQRGLLGYIDAVGRLSQIEDSTRIDPFSALLGRGGGGSLQAGQGVFGQAGYGLQSGPQYLNPEAGLSYISNRAANQASMYGANVAADAARTAGLYQGLGSAVGGAFGMFNFG